MIAIAPVVPHNHKITNLPVGTIFFTQIKPNNSHAFKQMTYCCRHTSRLYPRQCEDLYISVTVCVCVCIHTHTHVHEGNSKINIRLVGKKKHVVIAPKRRLCSKKYLLLSLNANPHTFSPRSVGVITGETWTPSSSLPPAVVYVFWDRKGILLTEFMAPGTTIT